MPNRKALMTAEGFAKRTHPGPFEELVRGKIVRVAAHGPRHDEICESARKWVGQAIPSGKAAASASVVTRHDPDTIRVADLAGYPHDRDLPEWIIEVRDPGEHWPDMLARVVEYHGAGVTTIVVLDDDSKTAHVYGPDRLPRVLKADEDLVIAGVSVRVGRFFEREADFSDLMAAGA